MVEEAAGGAAAVTAFERAGPSLVILDVNLPRLSGLEVCRQIRADGSAIPIMMLTVRNAEEDQVQALDLGADDYLTKPFSPRTLLARVRALLRRGGMEKPAPLEVGDLSLDLELAAVTLTGGKPVRLTRLELRLLQVLLANAGHTLPPERLLAHVWGSRGGGDRQLLKQLVHRLRPKIETGAAQPRYPVAVRGVRYRPRAAGKGGQEPP